MVRTRLFRRATRFLQFSVGGRYSLLWLVLTLLARAVLRGAEQITAPPEVIEKAVDATSAEHEREAVDAAWELAKDIDLTSKGWYRRLRREWEAARHADKSASSDGTRTVWSSEIRTLGKLVSRRTSLLKHVMPRSVVRPFVVALWSGALALFFFMSGFFAVLMRLFVFILPEAHQDWVSTLLSWIAMSALPLVAVGVLAALASGVRGVLGVFDWLRRLSHQ